MAAQDDDGGDMARRTSRFETQGPSLFERCFAALFSGAAAGATYAGWMFYRSGRWGPEQIADFKDLGLWIVQAGAVLGFLGGISLAASFWGDAWDTRDQPFVSLRTAVILIMLGAIAYGVYKQMGL
jgi:hypothetical protein